MSSTVSLPPVPQDAFDNYPGRWVAIRAGRDIVAVADDLETLRANPEVRTTDALYRVPDTDSVFL